MLSAERQLLLRFGDGRHWSAKKVPQASAKVVEFSKAALLFVNYVIATTYCEKMTLLT